MDRLQKKCLIASVGAHLTLASILIIGPACLPSKIRSENVQTIDFVPSKLLDAAMMGGGNPVPKSPPITPPQAQALIQPPQPTPAQIKPPPEPPKETVREMRRPVPDPEPSEQIVERRQPEISTRLITRKTGSQPKTKLKADSQSQERQWTEARNRLAGQLSRAAESIRQGTSSATEIVEIGPGGGGPSYASYAAWVLTVYDNAWIAPEDSTISDAITKAKVTIARDGSIVSSQIVEHSGDAQVDASVRRALNRVSSIGRPFPDGAKEDQRTYIIPFNVKAKRGIG